MSTDYQFLALVLGSSPQTGWSLKALQINSNHPEGNKNWQQPSRGGAADAVRLFGAIHGKGSDLSSHVGTLWMYGFGTVKGRNAPRAISKIMKWVPIVLCSGLCYVFCKGNWFFNLVAKVFCSL